MVCCAGCLDKCISLDATRNELISSLLRKITKYCHVCCFLEYCRAKAKGERGRGGERLAGENLKLMLKKISTSNINLGQKL